MLRFSLVNKWRICVSLTSLVQTIKPDSVETKGTRFSEFGYVSFHVYTVHTVFR